MAVRYEVGHAAVHDARGGGYVVHVTADNYWGYETHGVRGDLEAAKRKAEKLNRARERQVGKWHGGSYAIR